MKRQVMHYFKKMCSAIVSLALFGVFVHGVIAAAPSGDDWFQLLVTPSTGADNTGDAGTGNVADLNYYYVGQSVLYDIQIASGGAQAANIWIDYNPIKVALSNLTTGTFFPSWSGQTIGPTRLQSTGFDVNVLRFGVGDFGSFDVEFLEPTAAAYGTDSPTVLDINIGVIGNTTESNIALSGADILDDAEDFQFHIWADTVKPYAENFSPADGSSFVPVNADITFNLRDTLNGQGDPTGVGTGVNTATPPGMITLDNGNGAVDVTSYDSYSCSGVWSTNFCAVTVTLPTVSGISGDTRRFDYNTTYTLTVSGFTDNASPHQDQLGDANGPNTMDTQVITFTTQSDTVAPQVAAEMPMRGSSTASANTNITIDIHDRATYPNGYSGVGLDPATCSFNVASPSVHLATYQQGDSGVSVAAIDYGYRFTIDIPIDFAQGELVSVSAYNCADTQGNVMVTDNWIFTIGDIQAPYIDTIVPSPDTSISVDGTISFHVKDDASGVDLSNLVVYVNGVYYTLGGGAVSVATTGTRITAASSLNLAGSNYPGDMTGVSGTSNDYAIVIDPQINFTIGESIPVIIYAQDVQGNLMERFVIGFVAGSVGICTDGSAFCGPLSTWNGAQCVGIGSSSSIGSSTLLNIPLEIHTAQVVQVNESTALVSFFTNKPATTWVVYDDQEHQSLFEPPLFGYAFRTTERSTNTLYHSFVINGLTPGLLYHLRPIAQIDTIFAVGTELLMAPVFATRTVEVLIPSEDCAVPIMLPDKDSTIDEIDDIQLDDIPVDRQVTLRVILVGDKELSKDIDDIVELEIADEARVIRGIGKPGVQVRVVIYHPDGSTQVYTTQVNEEGVWEIAHIWKIEGISTVMVYNALTNALSDGLAIKVSAPAIQQGFTSYDDAFDGALALLLLTLFVLLGALMIYTKHLASRVATATIQLSRERAHDRMRVVRTVLIIIGSMIIATLVVFWMDHRTGVFRRSFELNLAPPHVSVPFTYEGFLRPALETSLDQPLYITHNERSLRFDDAASYTFSHVLPQDILRFTHPRLPLPIVYLVEKRITRDNIVFDPELYAAAYRAHADTMRSQGVAEPLHELVLTQARQVMGGKGPASAQGQPTYLLTVLYEGRTYDYYFIVSNETWRLLLP